MLMKKALAACVCNVIEGGWDSPLLSLPLDAPEWLHAATERDTATVYDGLPVVHHACACISTHIEI